MLHFLLAAGDKAWVLVALGQSQARWRKEEEWRRERLTRRAFGAPAEDR